MPNIPRHIGGTSHLMTTSSFGDSFLIPKVCVCSGFTSQVLLKKSFVICFKLRVGCKRAIEMYGYDTAARAPASCAERFSLMTSR